MAGTNKQTPGKPSRRPLWLSVHPDVAPSAEVPPEQCPRHGDMQEMAPIIRRHNERVYVAKAGRRMWSCPECCMALRRELTMPSPPGAPPAGEDPEEALMWALYIFVNRLWDVLASSFIDLGAGTLIHPNDESDGEGSSFAFETSKGTRFAGPESTPDDEPGPEFKPDSSRWTDDTDDGGLAKRELRLEAPVAVESIPQWVHEHPALRVTAETHDEGRIELVGYGNE